EVDMSVLSTTTKTFAGAKAGKGVAKNPGLIRIGAQATKPVAKFGAQAAKPVAKFGAKAGTPIAKRRARGRVSSLGSSARDFGDAARDFGETLVTYGPQAAQELGLVQGPKPRRTAPRLAAGAVIGAGAVYFLEP